MFHPHALRARKSLGPAPDLSCYVIHQNLRLKGIEIALVSTGTLVHYNTTQLASFTEIGRSGRNRSGGH